MKPCSPAGRLALANLVLGTLVAVVRAANPSPAATLEINTVAALADAAHRDHATVRMAPGTYRLAEPLDFSGSHSSFDLTGVRLEFQIAEVSRKKINVIDIGGSDVRIKGLQLIGLEGPQSPLGHTRAILIRGHRATLEQVAVVTRGSFPYGYGNLFGRGGNTIFTIRKFAGIVIQGNDTQLLGCSVTSHAFGHGIVLHETPQNTLLRECTVTGVLRNTNEILRETSGPAFERGFKMYTGEPIPPNKVIALGEDGIRVYGPHTKGVTIENCTITHMRGGVGLELALPPVSVTGCRVVECEYAYYVGTEAVVRGSAADARHGPALVTYAAPPGDNAFRSDHHSSRVELQILDSAHPSGPHPLARLGGRQHIVSFTAAPGANVAASLAIEVVGGATFTSEIGAKLPRGGDKRPTEIELINQTSAKVILHEDASACVISSRGPVDDRGKNNRVTPLRP